MPPDEPFTLLVKPSAVAASDAVAAHCAEVSDGGASEVDGNRLSLPSRSAAESLAERLTARGGVDDTPVAVQAVAPGDAAAATGSGDPADAAAATDAAAVSDAVDAYLVPRPTRRTHDPAGSLEDGFTFDTTATQYGALGETLLTAYETDPPLLLHYAREDLGLGAEDPLHVTVDDDPDPVVATREGGEGAGERGGTRELRWEPDCRAVARAGAGGPPLRTYLVEVKTGRGSLLRDQHAVMRAAARRVSVLKVQFEVDALPDRYTVRVRAVEPSEPGDGDRGDPAVRLVAAPLRTARLDEF